MVKTVLNAYRESLSGLSPEVWVLSVALFVNRCGSMVLAFMTLYLTNKLGFSVSQAGLVFSIYGVGSICGAYLSGRLVDQIGAIRIQITCLFASAPLYFLVPQFTSFTGVSLAVFALSLAAEAVRPANATAVAQFSSEANTTRSFGLQRMAINLGCSFGPAVGGLLAEIDYYWLFVVDGLTTAIGGAVLLWYFGFGKHSKRSSTTETLQDDQDAAPVQSPLRDKTFVYFLGLMLLTGVVFFQFHATYPKYLEEHYKLTPLLIGLVYAVNTVIIVISEMLLLNWIRNWSVLRTIGWGCFLSCLGFGLLPFGVTIPFLIFTMVVLTFGEMLSFPLCSGFVAQRSNARNRGMYMGWYTIMFSIAAVLAPAIGGTLYEFNPELIWYLSTFAGVVVLVGFYWLNSASGNNRPVDGNESGEDTGSLSPSDSLLLEEAT